VMKWNDVLCWVTCVLLDRNLRPMSAELQLPGIVESQPVYY
jgi:hypothetical protein